MAKIYGTPIMAGGSGGQNLTLPPMVTDLAAKGSNATITVSWTNPISDFLAGIAVVYNDDHMPEKPSDGTKVDAGLVETVDLTGLTNGVLYYIRIFPYNEKKQYQTLIDGSTISATPNVGPAQVTNLQVTGTGSSPVLTWVNPVDDPMYKETVVVQKTGSAPTSITDGTEIYRGTGTTVTASNLVRLEEYYWAVFTVDEGGSYRTPVVSEMYSYDFPAEPTSYSKIEEISASQTWYAPENGYFVICAIGKSGNGGTGATRVWSSGVNDVHGGASGGSGGTGSFSERIIQAFKNDAFYITIDSSDTKVNRLEDTIINAKAGGNGGSGSFSGSYPNTYAYSGSAGSAGISVTIEGCINQDGEKGNIGQAVSQTTGSAARSGGASVTSFYNSTIIENETFSTSSGKGGDSPASGTKTNPGSTGYLGKIIIYRGNTNIPSPSAASTLSLTPRNASIEASWTNSEDPESVGTLLVSNPIHEPQDITDGTAIDVAEATSYTLTDLPNDKPTYISLFSYNADKSKYSAAKSNVEIPREVTWADTQDELEQDVEEKTEQLTIVTQEYEAEVQTMASAGISQVKAYCETTSNPPMADSGVFASGVKEWKPDTEYKLNDLFSYKGNMGYVKQPTLTSLDVYPPFSVGTEALYGARPKPDADGIYPYVYNMGIYEGMLVRDDDGVLYRSITGTQERPTELLYHPKYVPTLLEKVEEGGEEAPYEEYPEWVRPTGAHDAYAQGAKVSHNGKKWTSNVENNVWEPGVYGWTEVKE